MLERERQQPDNIQIPENWNFSEKDNPDLHILQIDKEASFLSFSVPEITNIDKPYLGEYRDYFFDPDGNPTDFRIHSMHDSAIRLLRGDIAHDYKIHELALGTHSPLRLVGFFTIESGSGKFVVTSFWYEPKNDFYADLSAVHLGSVFSKTKEDEEGVLIAPGSTVAKGFLDVANRIESWNLTKKESYNNYIAKERENPRQVLFLDNSGESIYRLKLQIEEVKGREPYITEPYLVVSEEQIQTKSNRIVSLPLDIDLHKLFSIVSSKPLYPKDEKGKLVVPWRDIDRIVGVSLSYSYPPQTPQK